MSSYFDLLPEFLRKENGALQKIFLALEDLLHEPLQSFAANKDIKNLVNLTGDLLTLFSQNYGVLRGNLTDDELRAILFAKLSGAFEGNDTQKILNVLEFFFPNRNKQIRLLTDSYFNDIFLGLKIPRAFDVYLENLANSEIAILRKLIEPIKPAGVIVTFNFRERFQTPFKIVEKDFHIHNAKDIAIINEQKDAIVLEDNMELDFSQNSQIYSGTFSSNVALSDSLEVLAYAFQQRNDFYFAINRRLGTGNVEVVIFRGITPTSLGVISPPTLTLSSPRFTTQFSFTNAAFGYEYTINIVRFWRYAGTAWTALSTFNAMLVTAPQDPQNLTGAAIGRYSEITPDMQYAISLLRQTNFNAIIAHRTYNSGNSWAIQTVGIGTQATVARCQGHFTIKTNAGFFVSNISNTNYISRPTVNVANSPIHFAIGDRLYFLNTPASTGYCTIYYSDDLGQTVTAISTQNGHRVAYFGTVFGINNCVVLVSKEYTVVGASDRISAFRFFISFDNGATWQYRSFLTGISGDAAYNNIEFYHAIFKNNVIYFLSTQPYCLALQLDENYQLISLAVTNTHYYSGGLQGFSDTSLGNIRTSNLFGQIMIPSVAPPVILENAFVYCDIGNSSFSLRRAASPSVTNSIVKLSLDNTQINAIRKFAPIGVSQIHEVTADSYFNLAGVFLTTIPNLITSEQKQNQRAGRFRSFTLLPYDKNAELIGVSGQEQFTSNYTGGAAGGAVIRKYATAEFEYFYIQGVNFRRNLNSNEWLIYAGTSDGVNTMRRAFTSKKLVNRLFFWDFNSTAKIFRGLYNTVTSDNVVNDAAFDLKDENGVVLPNADLFANNKVVFKLDDTSFAVAYFVGNQLRINVHDMQSGNRLAYYTHNFATTKNYTHRALVGIKQDTNSYFFVFGFNNGLLLIGDSGALETPMPNWPNMPPFLADMSTTQYIKVVVLFPNWPKIYITEIELPHAV